MEGASEEFIDVYENMMHLFDSVSSSGGDTDLKDPAKTVYKNFTPTVEVALTMLKSLENKNLSVAVKNSLRTLKLELRFLRTTFRCMVKWCIEDGIQRRLVDILARIQCQFLCANKVLDFYVQKKIFDEVEAVDFDIVVCNVLEDIKIMKPEIVETYYSLFSRPSPSKYPMSAELVVEFIYLVIDTLEVLLISSCGADCAVASKRKQVLALGEKLKFLAKFIWFTIDQGLDGEKLKEILVSAEAVTDNTAGVSYFLWIGSEVDLKIEINLIDKY